MTENIELELRAKISKEQKESVKTFLKDHGKMISDTHRLSVMFFGNVNNVETDIRIRVTNGKAEVVIKRGDYHSHNRTEVSQEIAKNDIVGMTRLFSQLDIEDVKVGERETENYDLGDGVVASLVTAGDISYIELERLTSKENEIEHQHKLEQIAKAMDLSLIKNREEFLTLCDELNAKDDWVFKGSAKDYEKLSEKLQRY